MQIDRSNYEIWLIDWIDGNLSELQVEQLQLFLRENPDIKEEFNELTTLRLLPVEKSFPHKNQLKKTTADISGSQFEYLCLAFLENDLSANQQTELKESLEQDQEDNENEHARRRSRFRRHWSGIEFGFNNYLTSARSLVLPNDIDYMTFHSSKSGNFNINFTQLSLGLSRHIGFVTGLGLNWNNYRFDGNNNIAKGDNGVIGELDPGANLEKSKLATLFLTLPFMLEFQLPVNSNHLNIAAGPIGAVKLGSHTKMVFENGHTVKAYGDFSLNMLRYGATARVGYGNFQLYGTYYVTPLFQDGKGPQGTDLYPFELGFGFYLQ